MAYRRVDSDLDRTIFGHLADARPHDLEWEDPPSAFQKIGSSWQLTLAALVLVLVLAIHFMRQQS
jgi:hypothetical protein